MSVPADGLASGCLRLMAFRGFCDFVIRLDSRPFKGGRVQITRSMPLVV